jgi:hypothetical protein
LTLWCKRKPASRHRSRRSSIVIAFAAATLPMAAAHLHLLPPDNYPSAARGLRDGIQQHTNDGVCVRIRYSHSRMQRCVRRTRVALSSQQTRAPFHIIACLLLAWVSKTNLFFV